jgi:hypothetical protein
MSETKFTPGPWKYKGSGTAGSRCVFAELAGKSWCVASLITSRIDQATHEWDEGVAKESDANAHLIAAAPEMYEVLSFAKDALIVDHASLRAIEVCETALRKARGEL